MSRVTITISDQSFDIECPANQETYLKSLASSLQARVDSVATSFEGATLLRLLVVVALTLEDELQSRPVTQGALSPEKSAAMSELLSQTPSSPSHDSTSDHLSHYKTISALLEPLIDRVEALASE